MILTVGKMFGFVFVCFLFFGKDEIKIDGIAEVCLSHNLLLTMLAGHVSPHTFRDCKNGDQREREREEVR